MADTCVGELISRLGTGVQVGVRWLKAVNTEDFCRAGWEQTGTAVGIKYNNNC